MTEHTGAFAIMGAVDPQSFDTLHSFSNAFEMPFVTPWFPEKNFGIDWIIMQHLFCCLLIAVPFRFWWFCAELCSADDSPVSQCNCGLDPSLRLEIHHLHLRLIGRIVPTAENIRKYPEGNFLFPDFILSSFIYIWMAWIIISVTHTAATSLEFGYESTM